MKVIPLTEAKAHLSHYGRLCHQEAIIVTVNGEPVFQLVPVEENDDLVNELLRDCPEFAALLKSRQREQSVPAAVAVERLSN
jgi:prevent-host-death family protein